MTDSIDATECVHCGRSSLFDGVVLVTDGLSSGVQRWHCENLPCAPRTKQKTNTREKHKGDVRINRLWVNSTLERLSSRLSPGTSQIGLVGEPSKLSCPKHYSYDIMIPLVHASKEEPLGWVLFGAKYLSNPEMRLTLRSHLIAKLPVVTGRAELADLLVLGYCTGRPISERQLRRTLDLTRGSHQPYHQANERLLANLAAVENNYARIVRKYL